MGHPIYCLGSQIKDKQREEYIDKKANEMARSYGFVSQLELDGAKDFIRTLLNEAPMRKPKVSKAFINRWVDSFFSYGLDKVQARKDAAQMFKELDAEVEE